jgi:formylglycine-generating enzyme required for sulfatase activity
MNQEDTSGKRSISVGDSADQSVLVTGDENIVHVTFRGEKLSIPSLEAIADHREDLKKQLQADACRRWGGMSVYIKEEGASLPIEASPYQTGRLGAREPLLGALRQADRMLLLGGPGSGKTVSLERIGWDLCVEKDAVIPVLIRLFRYDGAPLAEWVRTHLQETGYLRIDDEKALAAFLKEGSADCFFLFDGLNEVQPKYRDKLVGELVRWMRAYPNHPVILTSRPQDELWRRLRGEMNRAMVVQPIDDQQARDYLIAHLEERGKTLYDQLDERLRAMARTPLILWLIKEAGGAGESIPGNRGELYARFVSRMLRLDTDRRMDADISERSKRRALAKLAYHLSLDQRLSCTQEEAAEIIEPCLDGDLSRAESIIGACARHGLLAGERKIWFAPHPTIQEYFTALKLRDLVKRHWEMNPWQKMKQGLQRVLTSRVDDLWSLAAQDWWMESFIQLAGITEDADRLAGDVVRFNPWLAWWCVEEGQGVTQGTRENVAERSTQMLTSWRVANRRRAVSALAQIRSPRTVEPLFQAVSDEDEEVAGLALQTLLEMGKDVREKAFSFAQQPEHPMYNSGLAYLEAILGMSFVWVQPGPFLMGSDKAKDIKASDSELPQHEVDLPGYWIGRYPVTVAQFQIFVEETNYHVDEVSLKGPEYHPVRYLTWREAMAYCRWLDEKTRLSVSLPSEAEWEKAARGIDGRIYPWGDEQPTEDLCNFGRNVGHPTPVGSYSPKGDSPYGCADMSGNVWEWTRSLHKEYPYDPNDGRENLEAGDNLLRVLRGGSFSDSNWGVRCACLGYGPNFRFWLGGFRVCVSSRNEHSE